MKRVFNYLAVAASAILVLSACTSDKLEAYSGQPDTNPESPDNAITFGTYVGKSGVTRAGVGGFTGAMTTETLRASGAGFGVFAFYTGTDTYSTYRGKEKNYPNFMYNEHVYGDGASAWKYDNIKYWPNEFNNGAIDDQNNDMSNDPAQGFENGGNVTFFAYAPWVDVKTQSEEAEISGFKAKATSADEEADKGITALSGNAWKGSDATSEVGARKGDPYITYVLTEGNKAVDLLWGTAGVNSVMANNLAQTGQTTGNNVNGAEGTGAAAPYTTTYANDILKGFKVNDNLNKMKTQGTVNFVFKHALAKIGGSYVKKESVTAEGDDENGNTPTNGLMVILDIDNNGAESGGSLQKYTGETTASTGTPYNTKVTINEIEVNTGKQLKSGVNPLTDPDFSYETSTENIVNKGVFNLATGRWGNLETATSEVTKTQTIVPASAYPASNFSETDKAKDAILSEELREPVLTENKLDGEAQYTQGFFEKLPIGVTTVAKNVYETESQPLVFIPGTKPILEFTITYTVRTFDENLKDKYTEVKQKVKKRLYLTSAIELNKQYNILMHLGLTGVKFTATVDDWDATDATGTTQSPTGGESPVTVFDEEVEHVYLPTNVSEETTSQNVVSGSNVTVNTAATTTSYTIKLTGITNTSNKLVFEKVSGTNLTAPSEETLSSVTNKDIAVTLTANKTNKPVVNILKITEKKDDEIVKTTHVTITQNPDKTFTVETTPISKDGSATKGTIIIKKVETAISTAPTAEAVTGLKTITFTADGDNYKAEVEADGANESDQVKTYEVKLTINTDYKYTVKINQNKD